jgi:hypothetical protein
MVTQLLNTEYCDRRDPSGGRGTAPIGGDGECPGGNARMEAGAGWRGGADGRRGIHRFCFCKNNKESIDFVSVRTIKGRSITPSISVEHADTGGGGWGGRGRASGHGRGRQDRRGGAARGAAGPGNSGGGTGDQGRGVDNRAAWDVGRQQKYKVGRGPGQRRVKRRGERECVVYWYSI